MKDGRGNRKGMIGALIFYILGAAAIFYCVLISLLGFATYFFLIWGVLGIFSIGFGLSLHRKWFERFSRPLRRMGIVVIAAGVLLFCTVEGMVLSRFGAEPEPGADYCIVLGAQWKASGPSEVLRRRLDKAVEYLRENPETRVIVTGGQGSDEIMAEADGMAAYLQEAGIAPERILVENKSRNTYENLAFSAELAGLDEKTCRVVVVTNNFHVFRALKIAEKQGYQAEGLAASSVAYMLPNNLLREFVGVLKDILVGNM